MKETAIKEYRVSFVFFALLAVALFPRPPQEKDVTIKVEVGSNVRVGDKAMRQAEPYIAAHPEDAQSLIISASEVVAGKGLISQAYFTTDSGKTWSVAPLPQMREALLNGKVESALDGWVTYAPNGVAYYSSLWNPPREGTLIAIYRSGDKGRTWQSSVEIPGKSFDLPKVTAAGKQDDIRLYLTTFVSGRDSLVFRDPIDAEGVAIWRSDDGGRSFKRTAFLAPDNLPHMALNPLVLPDGSLLVPYVDYPRSSTHRNMNYSRIYVVRSEDRGETFGLPHFVADIARAYPGFPHFAVDLSSSKFRGRIYAAWDSGDFGLRRVRSGDGFVRQESGNLRDVSISYSTDNGQTWSEQKVLRAENAGPAYFATLAVSRDGILGVAWVQHEKYETDPRCYRTYFAASVNGGETFTAPQVVSDMVSCPDKTKNKERYFIVGRLRGGDYIGLTAAADGSFHAVWVDARDGAFQVYTARIQVRMGLGLGTQKIK